PHSDNQQGGMLMPSAARFGLNELLDDTNTEDEEYVLVALVARAGCEDLTVTGIEIKLVPIGSTYLDRGYCNLPHKELKA
ncbi:putative domain, di-copper centre, polyphenol oxidase, partial [Tanacetum coccineum]